MEILDYITKCTPLEPGLCPLLFDPTHLSSDVVQRPCNYLQILEHEGHFENYTYGSGGMLNARICLSLLLRHLEKPDPSWSEIMHFASFLNEQLTAAEKSSFCSASANEDLPEFKSFVVKFMIQMSHDFALPSLEISDSSALRLNEQTRAEFDLEQLKMRRKWENDPHPYLFFNPDGHTFTFFGFNVNRLSGQLVDYRTNRILFEDKIKLSSPLIQGKK